MDAEVCLGRRLWIPTYSPIQRPVRGQCTHTHTHTHTLARTHTPHITFSFLNTLLPRGRHARSPSKHHLPSFRSQTLTELVLLLV